MCCSLMVKSLCVCIHQSRRCGMYGFCEFVVCVMVSFSLSFVSEQGCHEATPSPCSYRAYLTVTNAM